MWKPLCYEPLTVTGSQLLTQSRHVIAIYYPIRLALPKIVGISCVAGSHPESLRTLFLENREHVTKGFFLVITLVLSVTKSW